MSAISCTLAEMADDNDEIWQLVERPAPSLFGHKVWVIEARRGKATLIVANAGEPMSPDFPTRLADARRQAQRNVEALNAG